MMQTIIPTYRASRTRGFKPGQWLAAILCTGALLLSPSIQAAQNTQITHLGSSQVPSTEANWFRSVLVGNPDVEILLRFLHDTKNFGPKTLPKSFRHAASPAALDVMLEPGAQFGVNTAIRVADQGREIGSRSTTRYAFKLKPNWKDPRRTAIVYVTRDLGTGRWFSRVIIREESDYWYLVEFGVVGGKIHEMSLRSFECALKNGYDLLKIENEGVFKYVMGQLKGTAHVYEQTKSFLTSPAFLTLKQKNAAVSSTAQFKDALKELWDQLRDALIKVLVEFLKKYGVDLLKSLACKLLGIFCFQAPGSTLELDSWISGNPPGIGSTEMPWAEVLL